MFTVRLDGDGFWVAILHFVSERHCNLDLWEVNGTLGGVEYCGLLSSKRQSFDGERRLVHFNERSFEGSVFDFERGAVPVQR